MRQALVGCYHYQMSGKRLETVTIHHIYIMDTAIKFAREYTKIQTVPLRPGFRWTRILQIMRTLPELNSLLKKKIEKKGKKKEKTPQHLNIFACTEVGTLC